MESPNQPKIIHVKKRLKKQKDIITKFFFQRNFSFRLVFYFFFVCFVFLSLILEKRKHSPQRKEAKVLEIPRNSDAEDKETKQYGRY